MVVVVGIFDEDVDLGEADRDGHADASRAIGDRQFVVPFRDDRRLEDADGSDAGGKRGVRHFAGLDFSGIAGILFQDAGIDASQFHLFSPGFVSSRDFLEDKTRQSAGVPAGAKAARSDGIRTVQRQRRDEPALCGGWASRAFSSRFLLLGLFFASCREQVGLRGRVFGRGRGRLTVRAVLGLQARERIELAPAGRIGLAHAENVDHVCGPQAPLDGALDIAECVGRIAVAGPTKRLVEEDDLVGVALEEDGIVPVSIVVRDIPERIAEPLVESFAEALARELTGYELQQRVGEFRLVLGGSIASRRIDRVRTRAS
jgi:hypothetical protein